MQYSSNDQISYQKDLSETSEAFFAASVLVNLKAQVLESDVFQEETLGFEEEIVILGFWTLANGNIHYHIKN